MKIFWRILLATFFAACAPSFAADSSPEHISSRINEEFLRLRTFVEKLQPEFTVGGYLNGKNYGDHQLFWHLSQEKGGNEVIRIFRYKGRNNDFDVSFHRSMEIMPGRTVIRRFVGPGSSGWRNDTIDAATGEYLGSEGPSLPRMDVRELEILKQWDIELFSD